MNLTSYSAKELSQILGGESVLINPQSQINNLLIDSRKGREFETSLFVALDGDFRNGHRFVHEMYQKGVRNFLLSKPVNNIPKANTFIVESTISGLQKLGKHQRDLMSCPVIGVTGSNGKTIVKEWLYQLLHKDYSIIRSPKSYNSQIGVPLSVWAMNSHYNLAIFESGISKPGEMERLEKVIQPTIGVFTNIGLAHQENFQSSEEKIKEKLNLFTHTDYIVYCSNSKEINKQVQLRFPKEKQLSWGKDEDCFLTVIGYNNLERKTVIHAIYRGQKQKITIPFSDDASVENAMHCWVVMLHLGISKTEIEQRFLKLEPIAMRLEQKNGVDGSIIIDDAYNSDITAFEIALDSLDQVNKRNKTVILSDILQSGETPEDLYRRINQSLIGHKITRFIGVGRQLFENQDLIEIPDKHFFVYTQHFLDQVSAFDFQNHGILIKGARDYRFERIASKLAYKNHETQLEINLDALKHNLRFYKKMLKPNVKTMVMVKAYGYGAGGPEVARLLASEEVNYLGVAYADEGVAIRKSGISTPIMVMNPSVDAFPAMINYNLEPEIYSLGVLEAFNNALDAEGMMSSSYKIHLKLDTGMNRLGFKAKDIPAVLRLIKRESHFKVASVFSHLAASDDAHFDEFTKTQISDFEQLTTDIEVKLGYSFTRHICNTGGIERFSDAQFEMVRLGIGLYGTAMKSANQKQLRVVSYLYSIVVQVKNVEVGESIGYGRNFMVEKPMKIAIVPIGYADGLDRRLGNGVGHVFISGHKRKIIGNVCMDLIMVDVTGLPTQVNDRVEIFGENIKVQEIAKQANTISYEILTSIPSRVKRVYIK